MLTSHSFFFLFFRFEVLFFLVLRSCFPFSFRCLKELFFFLNSVVRLQGSCNVIVVAKSLIKAGCFFDSGGTLLLVRFLESGISY